MNKQSANRCDSRSESAKQCQRCQSQRLPVLVHTLFFFFSRCTTTHVAAGRQQECFTYRVVKPGIRPPRSTDLCNQRSVSTIGICSDVTSSHQSQTGDPEADLRYQIPNWPPRRRSFFCLLFFLKHKHVCLTGAVAFCRHQSRCITAILEGNMFQIHNFHLQKLLI